MFFFFFKNISSRRKFHLIIEIFFINIFTFLISWSSLEFSVVQQEKMAKIIHKLAKLQGWEAKMSTYWILIYLFNLQSDCYCHINNFCSPFQRVSNGIRILCFKLKCLSKKQNGKDDLLDAGVSQSNIAKIVEMNVRTIRCIQSNKNSGKGIERAYGSGEHNKKRDDAFL